MGSAIPPTYAAQATGPFFLDSRPADLPRRAPGINPGLAAPIRPRPLSPRRPRPRLVSTASTHKGPCAAPVYFEVIVNKLAPALALFLTALLLATVVGWALTRTLS